MVNAQLVVSSRRRLRSVENDLFRIIYATSNRISLHLIGNKNLVFEGNHHTHWDTEYNLIQRKAAAAGRKMNFNTKGLMSSKRQDWRTPQHIYDQLNKEFHFDYDPCLMSKDLHPIDMLGSDWIGQSFYVNPPYKHLEKWIKKCWHEWKKGKTIVMLIPSRTDTIAFHEYIYNKAELRFIKGRLCFDDSGKPAPFPSMIVVFRNKEQPPQEGK